MKLRAVLFLLALLAIACGGSSESELATQPQNARCRENTQTLSFTAETIPYVNGGGTRQSLDFYRSSGPAAARPVLVWFHGGGWVLGDKNDIDPLIFEIASAAGFHLASVGYRLATDPSAPWPALVHDAKAAIRFLKQNATALGLDPGAIIVSGESAGAQIASLLGTSAGIAELEGSENLGPSSAVAAVVAFYGVYRFPTIADQALEIFNTRGCVEAINPFSVVALLDCSPSTDFFELLAGCSSATLDLASPVTHSDASDSPFYLAHGEQDCVVPPAQSRDLAAALRSSGIPFAENYPPFGEHSIGTLGISAAEILDFLEQFVACEN